MKPTSSQHSVVDVHCTIMTIVLESLFARQATVKTDSPSHVSGRKEELGKVSLITGVSSSLWYVL